jgi:hypothetical protein
MVSWVGNLESIMLQYKVTKKYQRGAEQEIAKFYERADAQLFIDARLELDAGLRMAVAYYLYDHGELMEEFGAGANPTGGASQSSSSTQTSSQVFSPSPFAVAPRPGGMPPSSFKDINNKDDEKK